MLSLRRKAQPTNAESSVRAVGFVNYDARGSSGGSRRPCVIFLHHTEKPIFGQGAAQLILYGVAADMSIEFCTVPPHVISGNNHVQQVHISTSGEFVSFMVTDSANPDARPKPPMLFRRIPASSSPKKVASMDTKSNNNNNNRPVSILFQATNTEVQPPMELRACDEYINHESELNNDQLQALYFPQFSTIGDPNKETWVFAQCRGSVSGARHMYLVKLQPPGSGSFFDLSFFSRKSRKLAAASVRHIQGTDLLLVVTHKMAPSHNVPVRHFSIHMVTQGASFEQLYEVSLPRELSIATANESLIGAYVFYETTIAEEMRLLRDASSGANANLCSSPNAHFTTRSSTNASTAARKISSVVVAYVLFDLPVRAAVCGATTPQEVVLKNVVRLFVFRPRSVLPGTDWYIDLYFSRRNIAVFQLSSLGQMCVMSPGSKSYFVDVKYFAHDVGPMVSFVQNLDSQSIRKNKMLAKQFQAQQLRNNKQQRQEHGHVDPSSSSSYSSSTNPPLSTSAATAPSFSTSATSTSAVPASASAASGGVGGLGAVPTFCPSISDLQRQEEELEAALKIKSKTTTSTTRSTSAVTFKRDEEEGEEDEKVKQKILEEATKGLDFAPPSSAAAATSSASSAVNKEEEDDCLTVLEEGCFLGEDLPDCFTRPNCVPPKLPPIEVTASQCRYIIFFSTHTPALLFMENRSPVWIAVQQSLLHDHARTISHAADRNHDGESSARGMLAVMDRVAMSLALSSFSSTTHRRITTAQQQPSRNNNNNHNDNNNNNSSSPRSTPIFVTSKLSSLSSSSSQDRALEALTEDDQAAFKKLIPVFQAGTTRMRDPVSICMEWIVAAAYFRLGWRQNSPPRLLFDFSAYSGLIHPLALPRTTQAIRGTTSPMRTSLIAGGISEQNMYHMQGLVYVHPRDEFVKAVENRIDESSSRETLIKSFRRFGQYEEEILRKLYLVVVEQVRASLHPTSKSARSAFAATKAATTTTTTTTATNNNSNASSSSRTGDVAAAAEEGARNRKVVATTPDVQNVNELCFLLCRLTALEILGIRLDEKSAVFSTSIIFIASCNNVLPFAALCRAMCLKTISQDTSSYSVLLNPLTRFANKENERLNVLVSYTSSSTKSSAQQEEAMQQKRRRFLPSVNPSSAILRPFESSFSSGVSGGDIFGGVGGGMNSSFSNSSSFAGSSPPSSPSPSAKNFLKGMKRWY